MSSRRATLRGPATRRRAAGALAALLLVAGAAGAADDLQRARELAAAGRADEALSLLERTDAEGWGPEADLLRGVLLLETGSFDRAEHVFRKMIERWPASPEAYNNLAVAQASQGRYEEAVNTLLAALATHSTYRTAYDNLTRVYSRLAGEAYSRALAEGTQSELQPVDLLVLGDFAREAAPAPAASATPVAPLPAAREEPAPAGGVVEPTALEAVERWAAAWSDQRADDYLAAYSREFVPPDGLSLSRWRAQRRESLAAPRFIRVSLAFLDFRTPSADRAEVDFVQSYESDRRSDTVTKRLELVREAGGWKIVAERVIS